MRDKSAAQAYADEQRWIAVRRRKAGQRADSVLRGLALSGGGVRAATVARGFVEALARAERFDRFDYLSTVSGGSYIGGAVTEHMGRLGRRLPLPEADYPLVSPRGHWPVLVYMLLEWVPLLLPLLLYFGFAALVFDNLLRGGVVGWVTTGAILLLLVIASLVRWLRRLWFRGAEDTVARAFCVGAVVAMLSFIVVGSGYGMWLFGLALGCFYVARIYLQRNRHVMLVGWAGVAWQLGMLVVLSGGAGGLALLLREVLATAPVVWRVLAPLICLVALVMLVWRTSLPVVRWSRFFPASLRYQRNVAERFLPFSRWPQGRRLCALVPGPNPFHIINTSANAGDGLQHFELSALHCGNLSGGYAATRDWLPGLTIEEAVGASGGAVDLHATGFGWGLLASVFASGTGLWIPPAPGDGVARNPMYAHLHFLARRRQDVALRLSDGGFTDNTGILALLYRRTDLIVCLDNGFDPEFAFDDLQALCRSAARLQVAEIRWQAMEQEMVALRFSASQAGLLVADILYPPVDAAPAKPGRLLLVKLHRAAPACGQDFADFPHFSTDDQRLGSAQLRDLYVTGVALAERFLQVRGACLQ